jgi:hypothetical protein
MTTRSGLKKSSATTDHSFPVKSKKSKSQKVKQFKTFKSSKRKSAESQNAKGLFKIRTQCIVSDCRSSRGRQPAFVEIADHVIKTGHPDQQFPGEKAPGNY